jgi:hypothetical protein
VWLLQGERLRFTQQLSFLDCLKHGQAILGMLQRSACAPQLRGASAHNSTTPIGAMPDWVMGVGMAVVGRLYKCLPRFA